MVTAVVGTSVVLTVFDIKHEPFRPVASAKDTIAVSDLKSVPLTTKQLPVTADSEVLGTTRGTTKSTIPSSPSDVSITIAAEPTLQTVATSINRSSNDDDRARIPLPVHKPVREESDQLDLFDGAAELALVKTGPKARNASTGEDTGVVLSGQALDVAPRREASLNTANPIPASKQADAKQDGASTPGQTQVLQFDRDPFSTFGQ